MGNNLLGGQGPDKLGKVHPYTMAQILDLGPKPLKKNSAVKIGKLTIYLTAQVIDLHVL